MKKFILMSMLGTLSMIGKGQIVVNTSGDTSYITTNGQTTDDLKITGEGPFTAGGNNGNPDPNWYLHGYNVSNGVQFVNVNNIDTNGKYNDGVLLNNQSSFTNSGTININGQGSIGVLSADGTANVINDSNGVINIKNSGTGIATKGYTDPNFTGNIQNDGLISGTAGGTGISTYGSQFLNGGTVTNNGAIKINGGANATGVSITGYAKLENNGEISGSSTTNSSLNALVSGSNGAQIHNGVTGVINGKNYSSGIYSQNNNATNKNLITNDGIISVEKGYGIYTLASDVINNGTISSNGTGIYLTKYSNTSLTSTLINNGTIIVNQGGTGIFIGQSSAENNGAIQIAGNNATGVFIQGGGIHSGTFINNEDINVDADKTGVTLIKLQGSTTVGDKTANLDNKADLTVLGDNSIAVYSTNGGKISNIGTITVNNGVGIKLEDSSLLEGENKGKIIVNGSGIGILAGASYYNGSTIISNGEIDLQSNGTGIYISSGTAYIAGSTGENKGTINFNGDGGTGIYVTDVKSSFKNSADLISDKNNITGIAITNSGSASNTKEIFLTGDNSVGIDISNIGVLTSNTGNITVNNGIGIRINDSTLSAGQNTGIINVTDKDGIGISGANSNITNNGVIYVNGLGLGIYGTNSNVTNFGEINTIDGTGIGVENNSYLINSASLNVTGEGTGIYGNNSNIENNGNLEITNGDGIVLVNNSFLVNNGTLNTGEAGINTTDSTIHNTGSINSKNGITSSNSTALNDGVINSAEIGLYALNNVKTVNTGEITGKIGVMIDAGAGEYSGHFLNSGKISGSDYAIKFNNGDNVLELANGTQISGKINGSGGENTLVLSGDVKLDEASNFSKLVSSGNSKVEGTIYLEPSSNSYYYAEAFGTKKDLYNISGENSLGELTVNGIINVGINYDNIDNETDKTGKIIAQSLNLQNGKVVLTNGGTTAEDIITESGLTAYGDQIRVKSIIISNKQQAVNPNFEFQASDGMKEKSGWSRETVSRIENGVTVLDELYTNNNIPTPDPDPTDPIIDPTPDPLPSEQTKINSVPRNRVDLDAVNRLDSITNRFLQMEARDMNTGERRQSIEYVGTKAGSKFNANNEYNYDYGVSSDGIVGTTLHKHTESLYSGFTLGYTSNDVDYSNADTEKVDSFNINVFGRYKKNGWDLDGHAGYGFNRHTLEADWLGAGMLESNYDSHVLKTGLSLAYNQELGNSGISLRPNVGVDYILESEGTIKTNGMSDIQSANGTGFVGKIGVNIGNTNGKFRWNAGLAYIQNFTDTFHKERDMENGYIMEELHYGKENLTANFDVDYKVTDKFTLKTGYEYEKNSNYENHKFNTGISYILGEK